MKRTTLDCTTLLSQLLHRTLRDTKHKQCRKNAVCLLEVSLLLEMHFDPTRRGLTWNFVCCRLTWPEQRRISLHGMQNTLVTRFNQEQRNTWRSGFESEIRYSKLVFIGFDGVRDVSITQFFFLTRVNLTKPESTKLLAWIISISLNRTRPDLP